MSAQNSDNKPYSSSEAVAHNKLHSTETHNPASLRCHVASVKDNLEMLNAQNAKIHLAVASAIPAIDVLVTTAIEKMKNGGRLFYIGAGTSGRLSVLDASEMPPTYGTDPQLVQGILAGGDHALRNSAESVEDSAETGIADTAHLTENDILVGVSASGGAAYVRGAVQHARQRGIFTAAICTASDAPLLSDAECAILARIEAEIPAGSTRMFSGTAQKMILNMISTSIMIGLGKVYAGYMVDVKISNQKLVQRAINLVATLSGCTKEQAETCVQEAAKHVQNPVKPAIIMVLENCDYAQAAAYLTQYDGRIDAVMTRHGRDIALGCQ